MVTFVDTSGAEHQINSSETLRKAMGESAGRNVVMTDETGRLVSLGANMHQLEANELVVKALRAGGAADADDKKIQSAGKSHDKMPKVKKVLLINKSLINTFTKKKSEPLIKSHKNSPLLKLLGDLQDYKTSAGLI
jgi:hypothetical protein